METLAIVEELQMNVRVTRKQLINIAIQSIRERNDLSMFWEYVKEAKRFGLMKMSDRKIRFILEEYQNAIYGKGFALQEQDEKLSDNVSTYELGSRASGCMKEDYFSNIRAKAIDITPLRSEIPNYQDVIQPRPVRVYLLDRLILWPLFKVVGEFRNGLKQLYLIGRDRHTKQPFALGIPNGFENMPIEACLRWTLNAHKGDEVIEV